MKRYNFETKNSKELRVIEHDSGNYITHKDAQELLAEIELLKKQLAALKKDARIVAECILWYSSIDSQCTVARRILEATKED